MQTWNVHHCLKICGLGFANFFCLSAAQKCNEYVLLSLINLKISLFVFVIIKNIRY